MANLLCCEDDFAPGQLLIDESLYETGYRLEEYLWEVRPGTRSEASGAFQWLQTRVEGRGERIEWQRTQRDRELTGGYPLPDGGYRRIQYVKLPTGELEERREGARRWRRYPFHYTVLALHAIGTEACRGEVAAVAGATSPRLLDRYTGRSRPDPLRRRALEILFTCA